MKDTLRIGLEGHVRVTSNKYGVVYDNSNTIGINALEILTRCMGQVDLEKSVDKIKVSGPFGEFTGDIIANNYISAENAMEFSAIFYENNFDGTVTELELQCSALGNKIMATRTGVSILKDAATRLRVDWKITVTQS